VALQGNLKRSVAFAPAVAGTAALRENLLTALLEVGRSHCRGQWKDSWDTAALPAAGTSAIWKYKAIYRFNDEQVGQWSDVANTSVMS